MTKDNWIKAFDEKFGVIKTDDEPGFPSVEIFMSEDQDVEEIKAFISQVEKDAIEKTNKRWREKLVDLHKLITPAGFETPEMSFNQLVHVEDKLSDLLEDK